MQVVYEGDEARDLLKTGINKLCDVVEVTLGPKGRNVIIDKPFGQPVVTNDGATIIANFDIDSGNKEVDAACNVSVKVMKDITKQLNLLAGDGRTTACVLANSILKECVRNITAGADPLKIRTGLEKGLSILTSELSKLKRDIVDSDLEHVATIASGNPEYGKIIAEVLKEVTVDGVVTTERSNTSGIQKDVVKGMKINRGFVSPNMINNDKREAFYEDYPILLTDITIEHINQLSPLFTKMGKQASGLIIIADDVTGEALENISYAKENKLFNTLAIKAPGLKDRLEVLEDIATLVNGKVIKKSVGDLSEVKLEDLGLVTKIISTEDSTVIIGEGDVSKRIKELKSQLGKDNDERLKERIAKLIGGIAVLKVGGLTVVEQVEKQRRIEDALSATRAAMEDGVLPGGGISLFRVSETLSDTKLEGDEQLAINILKTSLEAPIRQIALNGGISGDIILDKIRNRPLVRTSANRDNSKELKNKFGYNFENDEYGDMFRMGIIDPYKVTKTILEVVISGIASLITVEKLIVNTPDLIEEPS